MKSLVICNTPFQCLLAMVLANECKKQKTMDLLVTDLVSGFQKISAGIKECSLFEQVRILEIKSYYKRESKLDFIKNQLKAELYGISEEKIKEICDAFYDEIFISNVHFFQCDIYTFLKKRNPKLKVNFVEEGYGTYTNVMKKVLYGLSFRNIIRGMANVIRRRENLVKQIGCIYLLDPELCCWKMPFAMKKLPSLDLKTDTEFKKCMNEAFGYKKIKDKYDRPYVFFEGRLSAVSKNEDDVSLVKRISDCVGKEKLIVKLHPASTENRFENIGCRVNRQSGIPWEIIAANIDTTTKTTLITISSGAIISTRLLFGESFKTVYAYKCVGFKGEMSDKSSEVFLQKFLDKYKGDVYIPNDSRELEESLRRNEE